MEGVGARQRWGRACLVTVALGLCACGSEEEIAQLRRISRVAEVDRAEKEEMIANREERVRELQIIEERLRFRCPPSDEHELLALLTQTVDAEVSVLRESSERVVLRLQGTGTASDLVDTVEALGENAPFLSLEKLSIAREAWSMDLAVGPACPTLAAAAAEVTRYPLPPRGGMFWAETSKELRTKILATERDIQRWESTVLAGGLAKLNSRKALLDRLQTRQTEGIGYVTGQLPLVQGLVASAVMPVLTLSRKEDGVWLLGSDLAGVDMGWVDRLGKAGYRMTVSRSGPRVLTHVSKLKRNPEGG